MKTIGGNKEVIPGVSVLGGAGQSMDVRWMSCPGVYSTEKISFRYGRNGGVQEAFERLRVLVNATDSNAELLRSMQEKAWKDHTAELQRRIEKLEAEIERLKQPNSVSINKAKPVIIGRDILD